MYTLHLDCYGNKSYYSQLSQWPPQLGTARGKQNLPAVALVTSGLTALSRVSPVNDGFFLAGEDCFENVLPFIPRLRFIIIIIIILLR